MLKRLFIAALAAGGFAASAATAHTPHAEPGAGLPDFPTYARPGECWARVPASPAAEDARRGQSVWTLRKGTGPDAVWSYSERPAPGAMAQGADLNWARVDCAGRRPFARAEGPPTAPMAAHHAAPSPVEIPAPSPPPMRSAGRGPMQDLGPYAQGDAMIAPNPYRPGPDTLPPSPPMHGPGRGPMHDLGPYAGGEAMMNPYGPGPDMPPPPPPVFDGAPPQFAPRPPMRPVAPWFGGRMLSWPGKTLR